LRRRRPFDRHRTEVRKRAALIACSFQASEPMRLRRSARREKRRGHRKPGKKGTDNRRWFSPAARAGGDRELSARASLGEDPSGRAERDGERRFCARVRVGLRCWWCAGPVETRAEMGVLRALSAPSLSPGERRKLTSFSFLPSSKAYRSRTPAAQSRSSATRLPRRGNRRGRGRWGGGTEARPCPAKVEPDDPARWRTRAGPVADGQEERRGVALRPWAPTHAAVMMAGVERVSSAVGVPGGTASEGPAKEDAAGVPVDEQLSEQALYEARLKPCEFTRRPMASTVVRRPRPNETAGGLAMVTRMDWRRTIARLPSAVDPQHVNRAVAVRPSASRRRWPDRWNEATAGLRRCAAPGGELVGCRGRHPRCWRMGGTRPATALRSMGEANAG